MGANSSDEFDAARRRLVDEVSKIFGEAVSRDSGTVDRLAEKIRSALLDDLRQLGVPPTGDPQVLQKLDAISQRLVDLTALVNGKEPQPGRAPSHDDRSVFDERPTQSVGPQNGSTDGTDSGSGQGAKPGILAPLSGFIHRNRIWMVLAALLVVILVLVVGYAVRQAGDPPFFSAAEKKSEATVSDPASEAADPQSATEKRWREAVSTLIDTSTFFKDHRALICGSDPVTLNCRTFNVARQEWEQLPETDLARLSKVRDELRRALNCRAASAAEQPATDDATASDTANVVAAYPAVEPALRRAGIIKSIATCLEADA